MREKDRQSRGGTTHKGCVEELLNFITWRSRPSRFGIPPLNLRAGIRSDCLPDGPFTAEDVTAEDEVIFAAAPPLVLRQERSRRTVVAWLRRLGILTSVAISGFDERNQAT